MNSLFNPDNERERERKESDAACGVSSSALMKHEKSNKIRDKIMNLQRSVTDITIFKLCHSSTVAYGKCSFMFEVIFM
jgi:hypothetical protein